LQAARPVDEGRDAHATNGLSLPRATARSRRRLPPPARPLVIVALGIAFGTLGNQPEGGSPITAMKYPSSFS
jgi:hypothetical protein